MEMNQPQRDELQALIKSELEALLCDAVVAGRPVEECRAELRRRAEVLRQM
jgi:hypothetical protein